MFYIYILILKFIQFQVARMITKGGGKDSPQISFCHYSIDFLKLNLQLFDLLFQAIWFCGHPVNMHLGQVTIDL